MAAVNAKKKLLRNQELFLFPSTCLCVKRLYRNIGFASSLFLKFYKSVYFSMQSMVFTCVYILARVVLGTALPNDDVSGNSCLTTEDLYPESFRF